MSWPGKDWTPAQRQRWEIKAANGQIVPRALNTALSTKDRCQWIESGDGEWPPVYCGDRRCGPMAYCKAHTKRAYRSASGAV